jgi:hypothetical protein
MSVASVFSSSSSLAARRGSTDVTLAPVTSSTVVPTADTSKLVFRGNPNEWYCFMVLKKPKDQDIADAMAEAEGMDDAATAAATDEFLTGNDDGSTSTPVVQNRNGRPKKKTRKLKNNREGGGDSSDDDEEEEDDGGDDPEGSDGDGEKDSKINRKKKKSKRRKQNTRTSIHCGIDPFGYIRAKNHEAPVTASESLLKIFGAFHEGHSSATRGTKPVDHDQGCGASHAKKTSRGSRATAGFAVSPRGSPEVPTKKRKKFSHHIVSIMGPVRTENAAQIIEVIWNYKSRAVSPRVVWAKVIADKFGLVVWHDMRNVFTLKHYDVVHVGQNVYIRLKRTSRAIADELSADLEMFIHKKEIAPHVL